MLSDPLRVVATLGKLFDDMGIRYLVGGSLASSVYGTPRATQDVDVVADLHKDHVDALVSALEPEFYVNLAAVREAVDQRASFNAIHLATMFKADVFVAGDDAWSREELSRARLERFAGAGGTASIRFAAPEDTLLHKLVWFRLGSETSERQWRDVLGLLDVQGSLLDQEYLHRWAPRLNVADLLQKARQEVS
jgi:hypothetical protein